MACGVDAINRYVVVVTAEHLTIERSLPAPLPLPRHKVACLDNL